MGSAMHKVVTTQRYEFRMTSPVDHHDMHKALRWAEQEFVKAKGRNVQYADDIWVEGDEESVTVYFTVEVNP